MFAYIPERFMVYRKAELMGYLKEIFVIDNLVNTLTDLLGTSMLQGIDDCIPSFLAIVNSSGHPIILKASWQREA